MKKLALLLIILCSITACNKSLTKQIEMAESQEVKDDLLIQQYLKKNKIRNAKRTEEGVYYLITRKGDGTYPTLDYYYYLDCHYKAYLLDDSEFDSSYKRNSHTTVALLAVIKGWQIGLQKVSNGGAITLFIPSHLGYGERSVGNKIPANSVLVFDIELLDFKPSN